MFEAGTRYQSARGAMVEVVAILAHGGGRKLANGSQVTGPIVWVRDLHNDSGGKTRTVTNDPEGVVAGLHQAYPGYRIIYQDTEGKWDELTHDNAGNFANFLPARHLDPTRGRGAVAADAGEG